MNTYSNNKSNKVLSNLPKGKKKNLWISIFDLDRWYEIWQTITQNKSRSVLTAFGVFWGMFMLIILVGAGNALQKTMMKEIEGFATNSCFVMANQTSVPYKGLAKKRYWNIINSDIPVLQEKISAIEYISPIIFGGQVNVAYGEKNDSFFSRGIYPNYNAIDKSPLMYGRFINDIDIAEHRKVCVIGKRVYETLFNKGENPLGKMIRVQGIYFQIIGVTGNSAGNIDIGGNAKSTIVLPFSTMQQAFNQGNIIDFMAVTAKKGVPVKVVADQLKIELKKLHSIAPTDDSAVEVINLEEMFNMFLYLGIGIAILIWIVGLGTLAAGGVGVSNIMLVTVRERTKEIGIKRALGATPNNIISQIMTESVILTLIAGVIGILLGVGILQIVDILTRNSEDFSINPQISFSIAIGALIIICIIGLLAGLIPARRAISIKAIDAIRDEN